MRNILGNIIKNLKGYSVFIILTVITGLFFYASQAQAVDPGTSEDPIVSRSYVDSKIMDLKSYVDSLKTYVDTKVAQAGTGNGTANPPASGSTGNSGNSDDSGSAAATYVRVDLNPGQKLTAEAYTEFIVRAGSVTAVTTQTGGLSDVTSGVDIVNGSSVPANHLIIVPAADGRGVKCVQKAILLVKGGYKVE